MYLVNTQKISFFVIVKVAQGLLCMYTKFEKIVDLAGILWYNLMLYLLF